MGEWGSVYSQVRNTLIHANLPLSRVLISCYSYTQLTSKDFGRFFGCRNLSVDPAWGIVQFAPESLPRPMDQLPSREELTSWLNRVLINILAPSKTGSGMLNWVRVRYPNNLTMFVRLLMRLHEIGYPSHWLSEYLHVVISDGLVTDVVPYLGDAPIPLSHMQKRGARRQVNLDPWRVELETILALGYEAIPFPVPLPDDFARTHNDIATFEAPAPPCSMMTMANMYCYDPVFTLIFFKSEARNMNLFRELPPKFMSEILEGRHLRKGDAYVTGTVDVLGKESNIVRWRMSRERVHQMQMQKWRFLVHRFDLDEGSECCRYSSLKSTNVVSSRSVRIYSSKQMEGGRIVCLDVLGTTMNWRVFC